MRNFEKRHKIISASLALAAGSLSLSGCGNNIPKSANEIPVATSTPNSNSQGEGINITNPININGAGSSSSLNVNPIRAKLVKILNSVEHGLPAEVPTMALSLPGSTETIGQPIIFNVSGQTYGAYEQGGLPDFSQSPAKLAASMTIIKEDGNLSLENASLTKNGELEDTQYQPVGYALSSSS